jgi:hypothetical protein
MPLFFYSFLTNHLHFSVYSIILRIDSHAVHKDEHEAAFIFIWHAGPEHY